MVKAALAATALMHNRSKREKDGTLRYRPSCWWELFVVHFDQLSRCS